MPTLTPLRFQPIFRRYLWGGRRLASLLEKSIGPESDYAESWEIVDHGPDQSVVLAGPAAGSTLGELLATHEVELLGRDRAEAPRVPLGGPCTMRAQFPLLLKFLDANQNLSVQVHPNDQQAARRLPPDLGKTEAWVVLHADPGSKIYAGLKRGFDRPLLEREIQRGTTELCLHCFEPHVGDCVFIPAGTIHALGAGLVVAEIQQSSDTTFRLFDWNRVGPDGRPRPLHVQEALAVTDFARGPVDPVRPTVLPDGQTQRLVECSKFVLDRRQFHTAATVGGDDRCRLLVVVDGQLEVAGDPVGQPLRRGQTMLVPAAAGPVTARPLPAATVLEVRLG